jgi:two-component sensor histidine kinase
MCIPAGIDYNSFDMYLSRPKQLPVAWLGMLLVFYATVARSETAAVAANASPTNSTLDAKYGVGSWIWAAETHDQQLCRFWRGFEIPEGTKVVKARLRITVDNSYSLFLDGRELGRGGDWLDLAEYDLTLLLEPGLHTLAVEGFNTIKDAGLLAGLHVELADGRIIEIASDQSWKVVPNTESRWLKRTRARENWPPATVVKAFGLKPWGGKMVLVKAPQLYPIVSQFWQEGWFQIMLLSLCAIAAAMCLRLMGKLVIHSQAEQVVQRERARIARDIHDDLTAGLTQLVLMGEVAQSELPAGSEPRRRVDKVCEKARGLSRSMNEVIWMVNSQRDTLHAFTSYVCKYAETFLQPTSIRCRFNIEEEMPDLPCDMGVRRNLFLAVKEALNNTVRHSEATELVLSIHRRGQGIVVVMEDDGIGFEPALADRERNGLSNMMERASEAGGTCSVTTQPGAGCRVEFVVPLARPAQLHSNLLSRLWKRCAPSRAMPQAAPAVSAPPVQSSNSAP